MDYIHFCIVILYPRPLLHLFYDILLPQCDSKRNDDTLNSFNLPNTYNITYDPYDYNCTIWKEGQNSQQGCTDIRFVFNIIWFSTHKLYIHQLHFYKGTSISPKFKIKKKFYTYNFFRFESIVKMCLMDQLSSENVIKISILTSMSLFILFFWFILLTSFTYFYKIR